MRLWHYKLFEFLPRSQLIAQWRELNSIFKKQDNHILINYVYEYPKEDLMEYWIRLKHELNERKINIHNDRGFEYFGEDGKKIFSHLCYLRGESPTFGYNPFPNHHTNRYLLQCFYNLQEKYDRGQKDFSKEQYLKLYEFVKSTLITEEINYTIHEKLRVLFETSKEEQ